MAQNIAAEHVLERMLHIMKFLNATIQSADLQFLVGMETYFLIFIFLKIRQLRFLSWSWRINYVPCIVIFGFKDYKFNQSLKFIYKWLFSFSKHPLPKSKLSFIWKIIRTYFWYKRTGYLHETSLLKVACPAVKRFFSCLSVFMESQGQIVPSVSTNIIWVPFQHLSSRWQKWKNLGTWCFVFWTRNWYLLLWP